MASISLTTKLDHIGVAGRRMEHLLQCYQRLGFRATDPETLLGRDEAGNPVDLGQQSAHIMFADSYIELSAVPGAGGGNHLEHALSRYEGLHIVALGTDEVEATYGGLSVSLRGDSGIQRASRVVQTASGGEASFKWFALSPKAFPEGFFCFVQHETRHIVFNGVAPRHPNGATDLLGITVRVSELDEAVQRYMPLEAPGKRIITLTDDDAWPSTVAPLSELPEAPALISMDVAVVSIEALEHYLHEQGVDFVRSRDKVIVTPSQAAGCAVQFMERQ